MFEHCFRFLGGLLGVTYIRLILSTQCKYSFRLISVHSDSDGQCVVVGFATL